MNNVRILVVDDDPKVRSLLRRCFENEQFGVYEATDMASALEVLAVARCDLVTLDLRLGKDDGIELARKIRTVSQVPLIMVTSRDDVIDRVVGLELGADDYITKPFHLREVVARVKSVLRRCRGTPPAPPQPASAASEKLCFDGLELDLGRFELLGRDGRPIELTSGDFKLLSALVKHARRVLSRERLMDLVGGGNWAPLDRTIDNQVSRLRRKIERDPANPKLIKTVRGMGYMFAGTVTEGADQSTPSIA